MGELSQKNTMHSRKTDFLKGKLFYCGLRLSEKKRLFYKNG